jgi:site-specific DNA-adenine methylase
MERRNQDLARVKTNVIQAGGKTLMLPFYQQVCPPHKQLLEPFGGGAAITLWDEHESAVYNDINNLAANFWRTCRDSEKRAALVELLEYTEYGRAVFKESIDVLKDPGASDIRRAWAWLVHIDQGFTHTETELAFRMAKPATMAETWARGVARLPDIARKLQRIGIECMDFREFLRVYDGTGDPTRLIVADPPYYTDKEATLVYGVPFTIHDHCDLISLLSNTESMVILCGYDSVLYQELLRPPEWKIVKRVRTAMVGNSEYEEREDREEIMWLRIPQQPIYGTLFDPANL